MAALLGDAAWQQKDLEAGKVAFQAAARNRQHRKAALLALRRSRFTRGQTDHPLFENETPRYQTRRLSNSKDNASPLNVVRDGRPQGPGRDMAVGC